MSGKHSGDIIKIGGQEFYLAAIVYDGQLSGYVLQPTDEFFKSESLESK